ncbi:MAG: nucleoside-diphosphate sugar epimerase/dehydratase [Cloacibacillus evryensis]
MLIAIPSATGAQMQEYVDILSKENVTVRVLPSLLTLADGQVSVSRLRSVNLEDLCAATDQAGQRKHRRHHQR